MQSTKPASASPWPAAIGRISAMPIWTILGLSKGKATTRWPRTDRPDGQEGVLGMPRFAPERCADKCTECADSCPTGAIQVEASDGERLKIDYGRCIACQLCVEICPAGAATSSFDWAFGVRSRSDLLLATN